MVSWCAPVAIPRVESVFSFENTARRNRIRSALRSERCYRPGGVLRAVARPRTRTVGRSLQTRPTCIARFRPGLGPAQGRGGLPTVPNATVVTRKPTEATVSARNTWSSRVLIPSSQGNEKNQAIASQSTPRVTASPPSPMRSSRDPMAPPHPAIVRRMDKVACAADRSSGHRPVARQDWPRVWGFSTVRKGMRGPGFTRPFTSRALSPPRCYASHRKRPWRTKRGFSLLTAKRPWRCSGFPELPGASTQVSVSEG